MIWAGDFGIRFCGPPLTTVSSKRVGSSGPAQQQQGRWAGPARPRPTTSPARPRPPAGLALPLQLAMSTKQLKLLLGRQRRKARTGGPVGHDVTASAHLTEEGRGGEGGQGEGEGEEERDEEERGANDLVSCQWRHVLSRALRYMHGPQGSSAGARAELRRRAHRAK